MDFSDSSRQISFTRQKRKTGANDAQSFSDYVKDTRERRQLEARRVAAATRVQAAWRSSRTRRRERLAALGMFMREANDVLLFRERVMAAMRREYRPPLAVVARLARQLAFGFPLAGLEERRVALTTLRRVVEAYGVEEFARGSEAVARPAAVVAVARCFLDPSVNGPLAETAADEAFLMRLLGENEWRGAACEAAVRRALHPAEGAGREGEEERTSIYDRLAVRALEASGASLLDSPRGANTVRYFASPGAARLLAACDASTRKVVYEALARGVNVKARSYALIETVCATVVRTAPLPEESELELASRALTRLTRSRPASPPPQDVPLSTGVEELCDPSRVSRLLARCRTPRALAALAEALSRLVFAHPNAAAVSREYKFSRRARVLLGFSQSAPADASSSSSSADPSPPAALRVWSECLLPAPPTPSREEEESFLAVLALASASTSLLLQALDDDDLFVRESPLSPGALLAMAAHLRTHLYETLWLGSRGEDWAAREEPRAVLGLFADLHERCQRHPARVPASTWLFPLAAPQELGVDTAPGGGARREPTRPRGGVLRSRVARDRSGAGEEEEDSEEEDSEEEEEEMERAEEARPRQTTAESLLPERVTPRAKLVLREIPMAVSFEWRVRLFHAFLRRRREAKLEESDRLMRVDLDTGVVVRPGVVRALIRRDRLVRDALEALRNENLSGRLQIEFANERGIDGGGLFKEFLISFFREVFDPAQCAAFTRDPERGEYALNPDFPDLELLRFVGRLLGKAVTEEILVDAPLAPHLLNHLAGKRNSVHDLQAFDPVAYRNLMRLKRYGEEELRALELTFSLTARRRGGEAGSLLVEEVELVPGGAEMEVTPAAAGIYVERVADFRLNREGAAQTRALLEGLHELVDPSWLRMFSSGELAGLLGGGARDFAVSDLRAHVLYAGGYTSSQPYILDFWTIVEREMSPDQRAKLLKFVTSCPRAPLLGFRELRPQITIHAVPEENGKLPTAATCVNLLRLPRYDSPELLRRKLLMAIEAEAGFELS